MKIKIYKNSLLDNFTVYMNDKKRDCLIVNGKEFQYNINKFKVLVCDIVSDWPQKLEEEGLVDGVQYKIVIKQSGQETIYQFNNKFPEDFYRLEILLQEIV